MTDTLIEYQTISAMYRELINARANVRQALTQKGQEKNVMLQGQLLRIEHDIDAIAPLVKKTGETVISHIQAKHGVEFKFLQAYKLEVKT